MKIKEIAAIIESFAPLSLQESYDNAGLTLGNPEQEITQALLCLDVTEAVIDEALGCGANLIISHHPLIFSGLKTITGRTYVERVVHKAIKHDIALYAAHTNLDSIQQGVNSIICQKLGLENYKILKPLKGELRKLVTFVPHDHAQNVRLALFEAGAGHIGEYDQCSYNIEGQGTFRGSNSTNPFVGEKGVLHFENETRIETIYPAFLQSKIIAALLQIHPYEEVAYDIYPLENKYENVGAGMVGNLPTPINIHDYLQQLCTTFNVPIIRHTKLVHSQVQRVAVCGGAGSFLLKDAIQAKAQLFISADFKYHQFFDAEQAIVIADLGHYETEQFTIQLFYDFLMQKLPNFACRISEVNTNPVNYFIGLDK